MPVRRNSLRPLLRRRRRRPVGEPRRRLAIRRRLATWRRRCCQTARSRRPCHRQFRDRSNAPARAGNVGERRRYAGNGTYLHHGIDGQQDLSGHRACARQRSMVGSERSGKAHRQQRSGALHAARGGVRAAAICARHDCAAASSVQTGRIRCCSPRSTT